MMNATMEHTKKTWRDAVVILVLCVSCAAMAWVSFRNLNLGKSDELRTHQLIRAINAATRVQQGNVADVQVKRGNTGSLVEVGIFSSEGRKYAVRVEGITGKVLSVSRAHEGEFQSDAS